MSGRYLVVIFALTLLTLSCKGSEKQQAKGSPEQVRRALDLAALGEICPKYPDTPIPPNFSWDYYIPPEVSALPPCMQWLGQQEVLLCGAYFHFNQATKLEATAGVDWNMRLAYFRAAVENLMDLLFDTRDYSEFVYSKWPRRYVEDKLPDSNKCDASEGKQLAQLLYVRRLKVQALELYRHVAQYYPYALVAQADASRAVAGNTQEYSDGVWGPEDDGSLRFLDLEGYRGAGTAFLLGTDITFLDSLVLRENLQVTKTIDLACGLSGLEPDQIQPFEISQCNERMLVPLPACQESVRNSHAVSALALLRKYGVPIVDGQDHVTHGADLGTFLLVMVNRERALNDDPPFSSVEDLLADHDTNLESLEQASRYLQQESRIFLYNLTVVTDAVLPWPNDKYLTGYDGTKLDVQRVTVAGRINGSRVGYEDLNIPAGRVPIYKNLLERIGGDDVSANNHFNYHKHSYFKTLSVLKSILQFRNDDAWWHLIPELNAHATEINEPYEQMIELVEGEIGKKEIFYAFRLENKTGDGPWDLYLHKYYSGRLNLPVSGVDVEIVSGKVSAETDAPAGARTDGRDGLRCRFFGEVAGQPCDPSDYQVEVSTVAPQDCDEGHTCLELTYHTKQRTLAQLTSANPHPLYVFVDGELVDSIYFEYGNAWRDWPPVNPPFFPGVWHSLRSQIDLPAKERVEKILKRADGQCSEPKFNSLGLRNDLVPPLENELLSSSGQIGGNTYEDSYQYYLQKAREAVVYAGTKIEQANSFEKQDINYRNEVQEVRAGMLNRLEQICGEGRSSCDSVKESPFLYELWDVPPFDMVDGEGDFSCNGYSQNYSLPNYDAMSEPPLAENAGGFVQMGRWLRCHNYTWFNSFVSTYRFRDIPSIVVDDPRMITGAIYNNDGEYLTALLEINTGMLDFLTNMRRVYFMQDTTGLEVATLAEKIRAAQSTLDAAKMKVCTDTVALVFNVIGSVASQSFGGFMSAAGQGFGAISQSAIKVDVARHNLRATITESLLKMLERVEATKNLYITLQQNMIRIQQGVQALKKLELEQVQAANDAERMEEAKLDTLMGTQCADTEGQCLKNYRTLFNVKHIRALEALRRAQKMCFIAKRALEFKIGVDFTREKSPGIVVEAPSLWQDELFRVFSDEPLYKDDPTSSHYVQKLEDYLFGYPFDHPFADEEDTAIISMRDDLLSVQSKRMCLVPMETANYVLYSQDIEHWDLYIISEEDIAIDVEQAPIASHGQTAEKITAQAIVTPEPQFYLFSLENEFYGGSTGFPGGESPIHGSVWLKADVAPVTANIGMLVSYYDTATRTLRNQSFIESPTPTVISAAEGWKRLELTGTVMAPQPDETIRVRLVVQGEQDAFVWGGQITATQALQPYEQNPQYEVRDGCLLYEWVDPYTNEPRSEYHPGPQLLAQTLRRTFRVKCVNSEVAVVTDDLSICGQSENLEYFETDFAITLKGIMEGKILGQDQFAVGNYNYRIQDIGLNLVGSNIKDCSLDPGAGSACYANQFIPYDFTHGGHVQIQDYEGKTNRFNISTGVIHYAKALAAERLLTNPMSQTDSALLEPYIKSELRGRPVQGTYALRIYNVPGLRWENVEDVQVYLKYRYWSAFSNP